jgi:hypothetical protein
MRFCVIESEPERGRIGDFGSQISLPERSEPRSVNQRAAEPQIFDIVDFFRLEKWELGT